MAKRRAAGKPEAPAGAPMHIRAVMRSFCIVSHRAYILKGNISAIFVK